MYSLDACMVCGETRRTIVSHHNCLIFHDSMWQSDLALPKERAEVLYGDELKSIWRRVRGSGGLQPNKKGSLVGFRPFPELELDELELVIGEAFERYRSGFRERGKNWLAGTLKGTMAADCPTSPHFKARVSGGSCQ